LTLSRVQVLAGKSDRGVFLKKRLFGYVCIMRRWWIIYKKEIKMELKRNRAKVIWVISLCSKAWSLSVTH